MVNRKYIIADNQFISAEGLISIIDGECIRAFNYENLKVALKLHSDSVVIIDYTLFDFVSIDQMLNFKSSFPESSWLMFSNELNPGFVRNVVFNDPQISIVLKGESKKSVLKSLKMVTAHNSYICDYAIGILDSPISDLPKELLTVSEKNVLKQIASGKSTKEIAVDMNLSFHTINTHRRNIFRKIEVNNVQEAIRYAIRIGIVEIAEYYI